MVGLLALAGSACTDGQASGPSGATGPITDYASLMAALRAAGATVASGATVSQPFLSGTGRFMTVNGGDVQVFKYPSAAAAAADAARINPDGSGTATLLVTWVAAPHCYRSGPVIALYVGTLSQVIQPLESVLEPQFAGR